jgi:fibro-slime domain-containing protein
LRLLGGGRALSKGWSRVLKTWSALGWSALLVLGTVAACGGNPSVEGGGGSGVNDTGGTSTGAKGGTSANGDQPGFDFGGEGNAPGAGGGEPTDPCDVPDPPEECFNLEPSGPACGDGEINQDAGVEECDDGNSLPGDGCSGNCLVEKYWECPKPGKPCNLTFSCGDGTVDPGEVCDDHNTSNDDGCSNDCVMQDGSYVCKEGEPCTKLYECGDGRVNGSEKCDDGQKPPMDGDGCDSSCQKEPGYECSKPGQPCKELPECGNGVKEVGEQCDDDDATGGDGCSALCKIEGGYDCPPPGQVCTPLYMCGNGVLEPGELCDDKNTANNDGCSGDCLVQDPNYTCVVGKACVKIVSCGDGRVGGSEQCDDGGGNSPMSNDGCSSSCQLETGWKCPKPGTPCQQITYCGDGKVQAGEGCDDGGGMTPVGNDGCSAGCTIEADYSCPATGGACTYLPKCGDGVISGKEVCDDGGGATPKSGDGCTANCMMVEPGWTCAREGKPCKTICGDGIKLGSEQCDDKNTTNSDGCSSTCKIEPGHKCDTATPQSCTGLAVCGNGIQEGNEPCDDGNADWRDGCTPDCKAEPTCGSGACTSVCGDGILLPNAGPTECDDGNKVSGDGCSDKCQVESGYECVVGPTSMVLPMTIRDFIGLCPPSYGPTDNSTCDANLNDTLVGHPDFEITPSGDQVDGVVNTQLDADGKPTNSKGAGPLTPGNANGWTTGQNNFKWWYRDSATYNKTLRTSITLVETPANSGTFVFERNDTAPNTGWWPLDAIPQPAGDPKLQSLTVDGKEKTRTDGHNFYFTSETRYWFQYKPDAAKADPVLTFFGDDDVWVFIKNTLTADIGGIHGKDQESVVIKDDGDATVNRYGGGTTNVDLNLVSGSIYEIVIFQAERHITGSNYKLTLQGFSAGTSVCTPKCGNGIVTGDEECDDGANNKANPGYGECKTVTCVLGGYCGDNIRQTSFEQCDNGTNTSSYGDTSSGACAPGCVKPPVCGDGKVNPPSEACDLGAGNTADGYGGCNTSCQLGPSCGDGVKNGNEACDDGINDGTYNTCGVGCAAPPRCGDGAVQAEWGEQCDDNTADCKNCKLGAQCGNGVKDPGEECDDGVNNGGYDQCWPMCKLGPRCGDMIVQVDDGEECDEGAGNVDGVYGGCDTTCNNGPYCGDGVENGTETCDDGVNDGLYGSCNSDCTPAAQCNDGVLQSEWGEECDDAIPADATKGCVMCTFANCGNGLKESDKGEECDDGVNDGGYGECAPMCKLGPRCGDSVVQNGEQCDDGKNTGKYGECAPGCVYGPYCGDGRVQKPYEECDDKTSSCTPACKKVISIPK